VPIKAAQPSAAEIAESVKAALAADDESGVTAKLDATKTNSIPSESDVAPDAPQAITVTKTEGAQTSYRPQTSDGPNPTKARDAAATKPAPPDLIPNSEPPTSIKPGPEKKPVVAASLETTTPLGLLAPSGKPAPPGATQTRTAPASPAKPQPKAPPAAAPNKPDLPEQTASPVEPSSLSGRAAVPGKPSPARTEPAAKPSKSGRVLAVALASVAATLVAVLAIAALFVNQVEHSLTQNLDREDLMPTDTGAHPTKEQVAGSALNFVIMGYDSRDPSVDRSSSLMILHLNAERDQAYFITFPRDTWVSIPGQGNNKISAAYQTGGSKLAVSALENLTDTRIDHAALVEIQGFDKLTDQLGGVTVYNKTAFQSHGFDYQKGNITVSGTRAIYFVGGRNSLPRGDFDRAANERNLVRAIMAKTLSAKTLSDPGRLFALVSGAAEHLTVDKGLTNARIRSTVTSLRLSNKNVHLMKAPMSGKANRRGQRVAIVDAAKLGELRTALREDKVNEYLAKYPQG